MNQHAIAIDIGGTNTRVALVDDTYHIIDRHQFATDAKNPEITLTQIAHIVNSYNVPIAGAGMSCPGPIDIPNGRILTPPNLIDQWHHFKVAKELSNLIHLPVHLNNDANLAALAEATLGEGKDCRYVQFLTISTGLGAGFVIDKKIYLGSHGYANEVANCIMQKNGPQHGSLLPGGLEAISSGTAITTRAKTAGLDVSHAGEVNELAQKGNAIAQSIMDDAKEYLANFISFIYAFADPDIVILGGSVALKIDGFTEEIEALVKTKVYDVMKPYIKVRRSTLNEDSGLLGAAYLALHS